MGVYIPPEGDKGNASESNNNNNGKGNVEIPSISNLIPHNPSLGLDIWGPLVPASDNVIALSILTSFQIGLGLVAFNRSRRLAKVNLLRNGIENTFYRKFSKYSYIVGGCYLIFNGGLEITRLVLPYDPWYEEAKHYRRAAIKQGNAPNWWFGPIGMYKPMTTKEWNQKLDDWVKSKIDVVQHEGSVIYSKDGDQAISSRSILNNLAKNAKYADIHNTLYDSNTKRFHNMLKEDLKDVNEINKGNRLDLIMEGKSDVKYNEEYTKPHMQLKNHSMETDEDFNLVWSSFEPWEELKSDTEFDIRLVPRSRNLSADDDNQEDT